MKMFSGQTGRGGTADCPVANNNLPVSVPVYSLEVLQGVSLEIVPLPDSSMKPYPV